MDDRSRLITLYEKTFKGPVKGIRKLPGAGSSRKYYRLFTTEAEHPTMIGAVVSDIREANAFTGLSEIFRSQGCQVPRLFAYDPEEGCYLQEDLGDVSLFSLLKSAEAKPLIMQTLKHLVKLQSVASSLWGSRVFNGPFDESQIRWDLNYFKYCFLKPLDIDFDEEKLEKDFIGFAASLCPYPEGTVGFMYRDCQSRNVMIKDGEPYFIDYQGGRRGPCAYDAVSFLWQAKAGFPDDFRAEMIEYYVKEYCREHTDVNPALLLSQVDSLALLRTLQVLGAYGLRGIVQRKSHFLESIPGALDNLSELLKKVKTGEELRKVCLKAIQEPRFQKPVKSDRLVVEVYSFSYKKGYPENFTGNGGGFMFDCRGMENPGRYEEFKSLTGRDLPVKEFLERRGEVFPFLEGAKAMVTPAVDNYIRRGFKNLQIGFGCTGGQHRSVYCADRLSEHLRERFPEAEIVTIHREQQFK